MSSGYISAGIRRLVALRAEFLCEYCLIHEEDTLLSCEIDHIVSERHGGPTREENLAFACFYCNRNKGSDIASLEPGTDRLVPLFNPRLDQWGDHFELTGVVMIPRSAVGEATIRLLGLNQEDRLLEREILRQTGRYPPTAALRRLNRLPE